MYKYKLVKTNKDELNEIVSLLNLVYPKNKKFTYNFIKWQYRDNPNGKIVGYNAFYQEKLVAHYVLQPIKLEVNGIQSKGLLSLNTATHPEHRRKGLFIKLANLTYNYASKNHFKYVCGVANENSTHGFLNKLGFKHIGPLSAKIVFGKLKFKDLNAQYSFQRKWKSEEYFWRIKNPSKKYKFHNNYLITNAVIGINAIMDTDYFNYHKNFNDINLKYINLNFAYLYVGIDSNINWKKSINIDIPKKFRRSPLNLILKNLQNPNEEINKEKVKFRLLDFDVY